MSSHPDSLFTGKERDTETGLDYFGARFYASSMGRWMSPDWSASPTPVPYADFSDPQTLNLYGYLRNNPLAKIDVDGHSDGTDTLKRSLRFFATALLSDGARRAKYMTTAKKLAGAGAKQLRNELKAAAYDQLTVIGQKVTDVAKQARAASGQEARVGMKSEAEAAASATRTSKAMNAFGVGGAVVGAVVLGSEVKQSVQNVMSAPEGQRMQAAGQEANSWGRDLTLGYAGAVAGAEIGSSCGPYGALGGAVVGSVAVPLLAESSNSSASTSEKDPI